MFRIKSPQNLGAAGILCALGLLGLVFGADLKVGTAARMGPGYFPLALSIGLIVFGVAAMFRAVSLDGPPIAIRTLRPLLVVVLAMLVFGLLVETLGFVAVGIMIVVLAAFAQPKVKLVETAVLSVGLCAFAIGVFVYGLGLPLTLWGG